MKRIKNNKSPRVSSANSTLNKSSLDLFFDTETNIDVSTSDDQSIIQQLDKLSRRNRELMDQNVFKYWQEHQDDPDMFELAVTALAAPATQVSVERSFNALNLLLHPRRLNLSSQKLNDILLIKLNSELFDDVNFTQMRE